MPYLCCAHLGPACCVPAQEFLQHSACQLYLVRWTAFLLFLVCVWASNFGNIFGNADGGRGKQSPDGKPFLATSCAVCHVGSPSLLHPGPFPPSSFKKYMESKEQIKSRLHGLILAVGLYLCQSKGAQGLCIPPLSECVIGLCTIAVACEQGLIRRGGRGFEGNLAILQ